MELGQALKEIHRHLDDNSIDHALIGGFALAVHGIPRATGDVDFLVDENDVDQLQNQMSAMGYSMRLKTEEVLHFSGPVRVDFLLARRPLARAMLSRAQKWAPFQIKCLEAEDLIGLKIQAYINDSRREFQDKADIQFLIGRYQDLDWQRIRVYADIFGQWDVIQAIRDGVRR